MISTVVALLAVGFLWGATNPFIRLGSQGIDKIDNGNKFGRGKSHWWRNLWLELRLVGTRWRYWVPFFLNQSGSVLYVWILQSANISIAVPVSNSLSFMFTAITGSLLGEKLPGHRIIIGALLVCIGSSLMIYDKLLLEQQALPMPMQ